MNRASMPRLSKIAKSWALFDNLNEVLPELKSHWIGWSEPFCFRCGWLPAVCDGDWVAWDNASGYLERAHLIDHARGGNEEPLNLVPLCVSCHSPMPSFAEKETALQWITDYSRKV